MILTATKSVVLTLASSAKKCIGGILPNSFRGEFAVYLDINYRLYLISAHFILDNS